MGQLQSEWRGSFSGLWSPFCLTAWVLSQYSLSFPFLPICLWSSLPTRGKSQSVWVRLNVFEETCKSLERMRTRPWRRTSLKKSLRPILRLVWAWLEGVLGPGFWEAYKRTEECEPSFVCFWARILGSVWAYQVNPMACLILDFRERGVSVPGNGNPCGVSEPLRDVWLWHMFENVLQFP